MRTVRDVRGCLLCAYLDGCVSLEGGASRCVFGEVLHGERGMVTLNFGCSEEGDGDGE